MNGAHDVNEWNEKPKENNKQKRRLFIIVEKSNSHIYTSHSKQTHLNCTGLFRNGYNVFASLHVFFFFFFCSFSYSEGKDISFIGRCQRICENVMWIWIVIATPIPLPLLIANQRRWRLKRRRSKANCMKRNFHKNVNWRTISFAKWL